MYQRDFPGNYKLPQIKFNQGSVNVASQSQPSGKFDGRTTNKEFYKQWVSQPAMQFGELPSFTGSILYPGKGIQLETTTNATFRGKQGPRAELIKLAESQALVMDGKAVRLFMGTYSLMCMCSKFTKIGIF